MRVATLTVLIAVALATAAPAALAQDPVSRAASDVPTTLFEPAPDGVPAGTGAIDEGGGASLALAVSLLAAAGVAGYLAGSSSRTRRS
jgi:hypothetical protein